MLHYVAPVEATQERFLRLLCADPVWLRDEFDAIVAANFGEPAERDSTPPTRTPSRREPERIRTSPLWATEPSPTPVHVPAELLARQRSPPV
ncbi:hypothetical protein [Haloechinothrix salitolerans]|uniref:Uncharacterized protein n=1 Tax=Haloechinothrix salitolerans TaxID=926830 RepID=A0ABW2C8S5_9PSEU